MTILLRSWDRKIPPDLHTRGTNLVFTNSLKQANFDGKINGVRCVWYGSGAPFNSVLQVVTVCSVLAFSVILPVLETIVSGFVTRYKSSNNEGSKGARMIRESWSAVKNICHGLTGGLLILTRRNEPRPGCAGTPPDPHRRSGFYLMVAN